MPCFLVIAKDACIHEGKMWESKYSISPYIYKDQDFEREMDNAVSFGVNEFRNPGKVV